MHNDKLLDLVVEQIMQDINDGDVTAIFDMLDVVDRELLINYLSPSLLKQAKKHAIVTQDEIDGLLMESLWCMKFAPNGLTKQSTEQPNAPMRCTGWKRITKKAYSNLSR